MTFMPFCFPHFLLIAGGADAGAAAVTVAAADGDDYDVDVVVGRGGDSDDGSSGRLQAHPFVKKQLVYSTLMLFLFL